MLQKEANIFVEDVTNKYILIQNCSDENYEINIFDKLSFNCHKVHHWNFMFSFSAFFQVFNTPSLMGISFNKLYGENGS